MGREFESVACPFCKAGPGESCKVVRGPWRTRPSGPHAARVKAAEQTPCGIRRVSSRVVYSMSAQVNDGPLRRWKGNTLEDLQRDLAAAGEVLRGR